MFANPVEHIDDKIFIGDKIPLHERDFGALVTDPFLSYTPMTDEKLSKLRLGRIFDPNISAKWKITK